MHNSKSMQVIVTLAKLVEHDKSLVGADPTTPTSGYTTVSNGYHLLLLFVALIIV